jgi:hypothetical protein
MAIGIRARWLILASAFALEGGCKTTKPEPNIAVHIRDAETKAPINGALAKVTDIRDPVSTRNKMATAGGDGIAQVHALSEGGEGFLEVSASSYLTETQEIHDGATTKGLQQNIEIELFAGPRPTIELVIPAGFKGLIKAEFNVSAEATGSPGLRTFRYQVGADGHAELAGPPVLRCATPLSFVAIAPDGTPLPKEMGITDTALRWVKTTDTTDYFVYGSQADCNDARKNLNALENTSGPKAQGDGKGQSKGGRGGRGGHGGGGMGGGGR